MNELVKIWLEELYTNAIEETKDTIKNERMWELGYNGKEPVNPHTENIRVLEEYIGVLEEKLQELRKPRNTYLMKIKGYFSEWKEFRIEADNKQDAIIKAKEYCEKHSEFGIGGNYNLNSIECVKKLK